MDDALRIRPATDDDVPALARIWLTGWHDGHDGHVPPELVAHRTPETFPPRVRERLATTWLAERDGVVLGFVVVVGDEVEQVYVDRDARGSGVARTLLARGEQAVADAGHDVAWLAVVAGNARARAFYERQGWIDRGPYTYPAETASGDVAVPTHRYERAVR